MEVKIVGLNEKSAGLDSPVGGTLGARRIDFKAAMTDTGLLARNSKANKPTKPKTKQKYPTNQINKSSNKFPSITPT